MTDRETSRQLHAAAATARRRIVADRRRVGPKLEPLLKHIDAHLFDPALSVGRMKVACGVRDNSISSEFHRAIGQPPSMYITARRMETATRMLRGSELEVFRLSEALGYSSLQVFSRAFVRWSGMRPSAYRRKARRGHAGPGQTNRSSRRRSTRTEINGAHKVAMGTDRAATSMSTVTPMRDLLTPAEVATVRVQAVWDAVARLPVAAQAEALRAAAQPSPALFDQVHQAARRAGREDRKEGVRMAELALDAVPTAEPGRASAALAALKIKAWAWIANARSLAYDVKGAWEAFAVADQWLAAVDVAAARQAEVAYLKACAFKRQSDFVAAFRALDGSIALAKEAQGGRLGAEIAVLQGGLLLELKRPAEAIPALVELAGSLSDIEDPYLRFAVAQTLASCRAYAGYITEARRDMPRVRALGEALGQPNLLAHAVALDGLVAHALGDDRTAEKCFLDAYESYSAVGILELAALSALDLATIYLERGDSEKVLEYAVGAAKVLAQTRQHEQARLALDILNQAIDNNALTALVVRAARARLSPPLPSVKR